MRLSGGDAEGFSRVAANASEKVHRWGRKKRVVSRRRPYSQEFRHEAVEPVRGSMSAARHCGGRAAAEGFFEMLKR